MPIAGAWRVYQQTEKYGLEFGRVCRFRVSDNVLQETCVTLELPPQPEEIEEDVFA